MAEKIKVSREVANFIESCMNSGPLYWEDQLLHEHVLAIANGFKNVKEESKCLDKYSAIKLAQILINGYEIEETPEEKLYSLWKCKLDEYNSITNFGKEFGGYSQDGFLKGIEATLDILGIKIEGINK